MLRQAGHVLQLQGRAIVAAAAVAAAVQCRRQWRHDGAGQGSLQGVGELLLQEWHQRGLCCSIQQGSGVKNLLLLLLLLRMLLLHASLQFLLPLLLPIFPLQLLLLPPCVVHLLQPLLLRMLLSLLLLLLLLQLLLLLLLLQLPLLCMLLSVLLRLLLFQFLLLLLLLLPLLLLLQLLLLTLLFVSPLPLPQLVLPWLNVMLRLLLLLLDGRGNRGRRQRLERRPRPGLLAGLQAARLRGGPVRAACALVQPQQTVCAPGCRSVGAGLLAVPGKRLIRRSA
jgi:hypothetical protein